MKSTRFTLTGVKEIDKKLKKIGPKISKKIVRKAMRPATKVVRDEAKANCPVDSGTLRQSIKVRAGKRSRQKIELLVTTSGTDNLFTGSAYYGGMVEWGTAHQTAQPFMRPAYDSKKNEAKKIARTNMLSLIEAELR